MSGFTHYLLMTSAQASVIIIALLASWRWLTPRVSAKWLYGFWVVAILRLVIPGTLPGVLDVGTLARWGNASEIVSPSGSSDSGSKPLIAPDPAGSSRRMPVSAVPIHSENASAVQIQRSAWKWHTLFQLVWLAGVLMCAGWMLWQHFRLWLIVRRSQAVSDVPVIAMLDESKALMGVCREVGLSETPALRGPALVGIWRPRILLPSGMTGKTSPSELRHVLLHELAHLRRWDLAMNWLAAWVSIFHWFNPLVRLACSRMRRQQEIACDDKVLAVLSPREWTEYGHTLVNLSGSFTSRAALGRVGILENNQQLEQRVIMISNHHLTIARNRIAPVILLGLSTVSILHSSAAVDSSTITSSGTARASDPAPSAKGAELSVVPGKYGLNFYHLRYLLTPENCELSIPNEQRSPRYGDSNAYKFEQGGQFEVFIRASAFPIPTETPDGKPGFMILRMPYTSPDTPAADQKIADKRSLFDRIQRMKTDGRGSVEVVIELDKVVRLAEEPLAVRMNGVNVFFRHAFGRYIDYTGPLRKEDRAE